ncbi:MAG: DEAD/DEAH box helicase [Bacteroidota bacterium]
MINQKNREDIIKLLDESKDNVSIEDLFLFDLSPYYVEKIDDSFFSKQLEFIQERNLLSHNSKISFTSEQINIYKKIVENKRSIVSAPTSFGKTMLIKEYINNYQPNKVVFIVPTNSLADELLDDFKNLFENMDYTIFDSIKNLETINEKSIFIGTQEKYYNLIQFYNNIDLFVIDEAYKLTDPIKGSREVILNRSFIDTLENSNKIILLMPLVNSIKGLEHLNFEILQSDYAPVAKSFQSIKDLNKKINEAINENKKPNLVYFSSPKKLEEFYFKNLKNINIPIAVNDNWVKRVEEDFHSDWLPIKALKSGIGIHYGPMPKFVQKKVIELFKTRAINNILATNSIIEGVNTPTKNIYIANSNDILGKNDLVKFKNLIGRAGRLGEHKVGDIFYREEHQSQFENANLSYEEIDIQFVIENRAEIIEINREDDSEVKLNPKDENFDENKSTLKNLLENSNYSNVPHLEVSKLLNTHGFTFKQLITLINYIKEKENLFLLGIIGKINKGGIDTKAYNVALNHKFKSFNEMVEELNTLKPNEEKSKIISTLIDMIYSVLPFRIIPLLNFTIDINDLYKEHNLKGLLKDEIIKEAKSKKAQFYSKFIGIENPTHESLVIVNKLFEYGIPYQRVKPYLKEITENLPNKFSIHDIKYIINNSSKMSDLRVYFE